MRMKLLIVSMCVAVAGLLAPVTASAQIGQTASLTGVITDASGGVLPGVRVTVTSDSLIGGSATVTTDGNGTYRFPSLPPGVYSVKAELSGFKALVQRAVLQLGQTISLDGSLEVGGMQESVTITADAPAVDVKSSAPQKNLTTDVMEFVPFANRFGPAAMLLSPGVNPNNYSSYGSGGSSSNAYMIDGVDVSDPEGGTIWVFANHNWIQEVQVIGLGANAEFGGFTGVASNSLFRSGSNAFKGLFETSFQNDKLTGTNTTAEILRQNPGLVSATVDYITDTTFQIGGPIQRDKLWFFTSFQYFVPKTAPAGFPPTPPPGYTNAGTGPTDRLEKSPRFLFKPTVNLGPSDKLTGFFEADSYTVDGRGASATTSPQATVHQDSPEVAWNVNYTKLLSSSAVFDVKYSGFWGYYYLSPYNGDNTPGWYDVDEDFYAINSYYFYNADRVRHQANASVTKFASGYAGEHNFKFGAEFERSYVKSELGYPGGMFVFAYSGTPGYAYLWDGYLKDNVSTRYTAFAQDAWAVNSRLTLNLGVRMDANRGHNKHLNRNVFSTNSFAPRLGFAFDLTGNNRTVLRGHYGWYFDGAKSSYYDPLDPEITPVYGAYINPDLSIAGGPYLLRPGTNRTMDNDIKHPRMKQSIIGLEHELRPGLSIGATGIWRTNDQFIEDVLTNGNYVATTYRDPGLDGISGNADDGSAVIPAFRRLSDPTTHQFLITNPEGAERNYKGLELSATKRMTGRWLLQASWVISKITGNYNNTSSFGNGSEFDNPNVDFRFQPFREGRLTNDNTHIAKLLGAYRLPFDVLFSGAYFYTSGQTFTRTARPTNSQVTGRPDLFIEPRGSQRYEAQPRFDIKIEKQFRVQGADTIGVTFEGFNVFNDNAITSRTVRSGSSYFTPQGLVQPRRMRFGVVYRF